MYIDIWVVGVTGSYICKGHKKGLLIGGSWRSWATIQKFYIDVVAENHINHIIYVKSLTTHDLPWK